MTAITGGGPARQEHVQSPNTPHDRLVSLLAFATGVAVLLSLLFR